MMQRLSAFDVKKLWFMYFSLVNVWLIYVYVYVHISKCLTYEYVLS